jgi:hypothetical protein
LCPREEQLRMNVTGLAVPRNRKEPEERADFQPGRNDVSKDVSTRAVMVGSGRVFDQEPNWREVYAGVKSGRWRTDDGIDDFVVVAHGF